MKTNLFFKKIIPDLRLSKTFLFSLLFLLIGVTGWGQYSGSGTFTKVTSATDLTDGYYVMAYGATFAMNSTYTSSTYFDRTAISPTSGTTITNPSKAIVWKIETNGTGKTISSEDTSVYASYTGSSNNIQAVTSVSGNNQRWSFSYAGGIFSIQNLGVSGRYLQYNTSSPRFACYTGSQQDITLYKMAASNSTVTFNGNGSTSGTMSNQTNNTATNLTANAFVKANPTYAFGGWASSVASAASGTVAYGNQASYPFTSSTTLYAIWGFTVSYNSNGGTGTLANQTGYYNGSASTGTATLNNGSALTRSGYTFGGWKTSSTGTSSDYAASGTYSHSGTSSAVMLYAHWIPVSNPVLGVTGTSAHGTICVGTPATVRTYTITNTGASASGINVNSSNSDFAVSDLSATSLATGETATFKVIFTPTSAGAKTATITVASTTTGSNSPTINLTGTGTANSTPTVSITSNPTNATICAGTSVTFTAVAPSANLGGGTASYQWKLNGANVGGNTTTYANAALANGDIITCTILITGGCVTSNTATSNGITMDVNPLPVNPNGEVDMENPYCGSATLVYQHGAVQPQAGVIYFWQTTSTGTSTANPVTSPYSVTVSGDYYVRAYNGICWSANSFKTNTPVVISMPASINTQPADQSVLIGSTAIFGVTASGTSPFTYQWQESPTGNSGTWTNVGINATLSLTNLPLTKNGYKYRVIISNSCGSKISNVVTLTVMQGPCVNENFDANVPANWNFTGTVWGGQSCSGSDGIVFNGTGDLAITPVVTNPQTLSFSKKRSSNTTAWSLQIQISTNAAYTSWTTIKTLSISDISTTCSTETNIDLSAYTGSRKIRFIDNRVSGAHERTIDDVVIYCAPACTPVAITAFPISGPAGTIVTINGSNFTAASAVRFGTAIATVKYINATQLKVTVPVLADGNITVDTDLDCDSETSFTLIKNDITSCEAPIGGSGSGGTYASDPVIYEVYDENGGSGGVVSIYNGTNATANLADYAFYRAGDYGGTYNSYGTLSGSLASGQLAVIGVSGSLCGILPTGNGIISGGFNDNDGFRLMKGSVIIDDVKAPNYVGYYMKRKNDHLSPKTTFVENEWTTQTLNTAECLPVNEVAQIPVLKVSPIVVTQPSYSLICDVANTSLAITATEGFVGGNELAYQWYVLGTSGTWTALADGGVYSGATTQTLNITNVTGLENFQYYCQVRENTQTCYTATNAAQIKESSNTWASNIWSNGLPILASKVIIQGHYNTQVNGVLDVCELTINAGGSVRVKPNFPITVKKKITNLVSAANFVVESDANFIQTDNIINEGNILVERQVADMNNVTNQIDYVYWSSPVNGQIIKGTTGFSPNTPAIGYQQYNENNDRFTVTNDATFLTGKGYAIRAETGTNGYTKTYSFTGIPNNGNLQFQNLKWTDAAHGFNLVGNPYPSNIDFDKLFLANQNKIYSTVWFWTNNSYTAAQSGSGYSGNNYAVYNGTGGSPATYNPTNPYDGSIIPNGKIKVGQAFIIQVKQAGKDQPLDFNNNIRVTDNGTFYQRSAKNRFWLNMTSPSNLVNTILVGYIPGATNNFEIDFDGELFAVGSDSFYSILGAKKLAIQGRSGNFTPEDVVALGTAFSVNGTYTIKLQTTEGSFDGNQTIYLRDKVLNRYINLSNVGSYSFEAAKGTNATRFEIVYKDGTLNANENKKSEFLVYKDGQYLVVRSNNKLGKIELFDVSGRLMRTSAIDQKTTRIDISDFSNGVYIIKAENSGDVRTKKFGN